MAAKKPAPKKRRKGKTGGLPKVVVAAPEILPAVPQPNGKGTGRDTLYDPKYCKQLIDFAQRGGTVTGFANQIRVVRKTLHAWAEAHPEFELAMDAAKGYLLEIYESGARNIALGMIPPPPPAEIKDGKAQPSVQMVRGSSAMTMFMLRNLDPETYGHSLFGSGRSKSDEPPVTPVNTPVEVSFSYTMLPAPPPVDPEKDDGEK